ncbi:glycosyltransferase [Micrococcus sp. EYE_162]|uniref:glycosyltransferase n=1 Tax=unclassified Micrococcus TaxID=2620948 RepID=UPI002002AD78|nr:glycosyltransferase [Micrococcus sp. EYE_212]MCK6170552.1 glycosyltransferase [Micrococcus sp. EYE_162]
MLRARRPLLRSLALTAQTVREHLADDPVLLALQISRRLPRAVTERAAAVLTRAPGGVAAAVGHEMRGEREAGLASLERADDVSPAARVHRADAALGLGRPDLAAAHLDSVPVGLRAAAWTAAAARLAAHRGDLDEAARLAAVHPRNRHLARRMAGERDAFRGATPVLARERSYAPVPGRVLHVLTNSLPHTGSGYAQRSHSILRSLREEGFAVSAVTRPGYPVQVGVPWAAERDVVDGVAYHRLLPVRLAQGQADRFVQHAELLADHVRRERPALLHTTTHFANAAAVGAVADAFGIPWVYEVRGQLADTWAAARGPEARESERYRRFVEREAEAAARADGVVTLGEGMRERLVAGGVAGSDVVLCPNAVGEAFLAEPPDAAAARAELGWDDWAGAFVVGTVSSIVDYEGLDTLLRAAALLAPRRPDLRVLIAGDGVALPGLKSLAAELGIGPLCRFPGRVPRAAARLHHAAIDAFVVPRRDLPVTRSVTPMKTVEASATARPVIASDLPALRELVEDGHTGLLFPAGDDAALADALDLLGEDPALRARLGAEGRAWALETRTWAGNARRYRELYAGLGVHPTR